MKFFNEASEEASRPSKGVISGREIVHDLRSGMTHRELVLKYGLSDAQLKKAFEIIPEQRQKVPLKIAEDVPSGVTVRS